MASYLGKENKPHFLSQSSFLTLRINSRWIKDLYVEKETIKFQNKAWVELHILGSKGLSKQDLIPEIETNY